MVIPWLSVKYFGKSKDYNKDLIDEDITLVGPDSW